MVIRKLVYSLAAIGPLRRCVKALRLHRLANAWLRRFPIVKTLPGSGIVYRATRLESLGLAVEMFDECNLYSADIVPRHLQTFADIGSNVGYFTCWLAHLSRGAPLRGLALDANAEAAEETRWHVKANHLDQVTALHGLAGGDPSSGPADFYIHVSNVCSTSHPLAGTKGGDATWTKVAVAPISIGKEWRSRFGGTRCHLLKLDIEGSEKEFLEAENEFLPMVDVIMLEWHKWRVTLEEIKGILDRSGFELSKILHENSDVGTAVFRQVKGNGPA